MKGKGHQLDKRLKSLEAPAWLIIILCLKQVLFSIK